ncbi:hypothetical protein LT85_1675 [Collimonas arenae]|uniref:Lipoprotein n=1 Tax=Collimonas arenae TaxID=279058 RepID=A0A0A1F7Z6_9BURK|nr:hypothetical protein [Collimonas arenae]AIY40833.1 hypothetical protein LT85_1675 [Collimonas arenae]
MRKLMFLAVAAMLAGCATDAERSLQAQRDVDQMMHIYGPACERMGYKGNSNEWRDCVLKLDTKDNAQRYPTTTTCFGHPGLLQCNTF